MTPWQYVKAIGLGVGNVIFCAGWLVYDLATDHGWQRVVFPLVFTTLLALGVWQVPRSLRSYRRMVESERALGTERAKLLRLMVRRHYPVEVMLRVDHMIMHDAPMDDVLAVLAEHRP